MTAFLAAISAASVLLAIITICSLPDASISASSPVRPAPFAAAKASACASDDDLPIETAAVATTCPAARAPICAASEEEAPDANAASAAAFPISLADNPFDKAVFAASLARRSASFLIAR